MLRSKTLRRSQPWLGTLVEVGCYGDDEQAMQVAIGAAFKEIEIIHQQFSFQNKQSELSRFNATAMGDLFEMSETFAELLTICMQLHQLSEGFFDPCAAHLGSVSAISFCGERQIAKKNRPLTLDLSGIAKGFAVDKAIVNLQRNGIESAWVNAGGDLRTYGEHAPNISIRKPSINQISAPFKLSNTAVASSGNYFHPEVALINPKTKLAVESNRTVTVSAPSCVIADGLCKAALFLPKSHVIFRHFNARVLSCD